MAKFRKRPVVIEATQFLGGREPPAGCLPYPLDRIDRSSPQGCGKCDCHMADHAIVHTLEGSMLACPGDWIITGVKGEVYPCKPDIFEATYEPEA